MPSVAKHVGAMGVAVSDLSVRRAHPLGPRPPRQPTPSPRLAAQSFRAGFCRSDLQEQGQWSFKRTRARYPTLPDSRYRLAPHVKSEQFPLSRRSSTSSTSRSRSTTSSASSSARGAPLPRQSPISDSCGGERPRKPRRGASLLGGAARSSKSLAVQSLYLLGSPLGGKVRTLSGGPDRTSRAGRRRTRTGP